MDLLLKSVLKTNFHVAAPNATPVCGPGCHMQNVAGRQQKAGLFMQVSDFFKGLFNTSNWPARWHCGIWSDFHGWLYILSDLLIWASYFAIPFILMSILIKRSDILSNIVWLFVAFIVLCGATHLMDAIIFWWPAYRLSALIRFLTGIVSAVTVVALYRATPWILSLRPYKELEKEIHERKLVEEKLAASEFLLKEAGRIGTVGGWELDLLAQKTTWSNTIYDIFQVPYDFDPDVSDATSFFIEPSRAQLIDAIANGRNYGTAWDLELQIITAKGNEIWVRSCGEAFYDEQNSITKLRGVFMDIDKYKTTEQQLKQTNELLSHSHQQLRTFTHVLSHNLRNHASNISLLTDLVDTPALDENNADLFNKIAIVSKGLNNTLDDLSEAIKIREGIIEKESNSFKEIAAKVVQILASEIETNGASVEFDFETENVLFPKLYLESILMNLISNAIKYRKEEEAPRIFLRTYNDQNGETVMECSDNGLGIDLNLYGMKIFGLYKTFHQNKQAHGVGLFLVKTQIESQGGNISVQSKPGIGTTFKITF